MLWLGLLALFMGGFVITFLVLQDKQVLAMRVEINQLKHRVDSLSKQIGWDDCRALTILDQR